MFEVSYVSCIHSLSMGYLVYYCYFVMRDILHECYDS